MSIRIVLKKALCCAAAAGICLSASSCVDYKLIEEQHTRIMRPDIIDFSWWGSEIRSDYTIQGIKEYEESVQGVDIRPSASDYTGYKENLDALIACRKEPDIMVIDASWLSEYSPDGSGFCNLRDYADEINLSNFSNTELSYGTVNGKLNAIPVSLNAITFYYNSKILSDHGLSVPETWDDLFACAEVLWKDGIFTLESSARHYWKMLIAYEEQLSGKEAFGESAFTASDVVSMMNFYKKLIDAKVIPFREFDRSDFLDGKVLGEMMWVSEAQYYVTPLEEAGGEVIVGDYLHMDLKKRYGWYVTPTSLYAISRHSECQREAARFLNFLVSDSRMAELQGIEKGVPLSRAALETLDAKSMLTGISYRASQMIEKNTESLGEMPPQLEDLDRVNGFFEYFDLYYFGKMSAEEAADIYVRRYPFSQESEE